MGAKVPNARAIVAAGYDAVADRYEALENQDRPWPRMRWLARLLAFLDEGSNVLEVGCGNGIPATRAIADRHQVTGIDVSTEQIRRARRNVPHARLLQADTRHATFDVQFDAITAFYVIDHLPREEHEAVFRHVHALLRPSGYFLFTIEPEDQRGRVGDWLGAPMFFSQHDAATTLALVRRAGFEVLEHAVESQFEGEREVAYLWVLAQKAE
jgi:cyclopropane fatty-acyl-phospholipid synthase-like methyltransferase